MMLAFLRSLVRDLSARRPAIAAALAALFAFKGLICLTTVLYPISPAEPTTLVGVAGVTGIAAACAIWVAGARIPLLGYELLAAGGSLTTSWLIAHAATPGGMMVAAFAYPWIAIYAAHFFPRRGVIVQGLLISAGFAVGLSLGGLHHVAVYWTIVTVTIWSICVMLGRLSESLRRQAGTDHLTGLFNRNGFQAAARRERALADRTGSPLTLAVIDLDGFKQVNDRHGHAAGDRLLAGLGRAWRARMRAGDILARHGGDEFVLLLPATTPAGAELVLARLRDLGGPVGEDPVGWSVGVGEWLPGESLEAALARADRCLYEVKSVAQRAAAPVVETDGEYRARRALLSSI